MTFAVEIVRQFSTALASLAAIRARKKLGIAIAARIKIMATTTSSSINEKPLAVRLTRHLSGSGSGAGRNNSGESQNQEKGRKSGTSSPGTLVRVTEAPGWWRAAWCHRW